MPITIVVGGQFGSEGKGKVVYYLANKRNVAAVVRVGGANSGHTVVTPNGERHIMRVAPVSMIDAKCLSIIPSGACIDVGVLLDELRRYPASANLLRIDPYASVVTPANVDEETANDLRNTIGSVLCGIGGAVAERIRRNGKTKFAKDISALKPYLDDTKHTMRTLLDEDKEIILEGTQGFGLSLYHSDEFPYCTSRDTSAAGVLAETGLSPLDVKDVVMVLRTFPIRVSGNSGRLINEITWERVTEISGAPIELHEDTTVTKCTRRIGMFDANLVKRAIEVNKPSTVVLNHVDYLDYACHDSNKLSLKAIQCVKDIESAINRKVDYAGTGTNTLTYYARWHTGIL